MSFKAIQSSLKSSFFLILMLSLNLGKSSLHVYIQSLHKIFVHLLSTYSFVTIVLAVT